MQPEESNPEKGKEQVSDKAKQQFAIIRECSDLLAIAHTKMDDKWVDVLVLIQDDPEDKEHLIVTPLAVMVDDEMFKKLEDPVKLLEKGE